MKPFNALKTQKMISTLVAGRVVKWCMCTASFLLLVTMVIVNINNTHKIVDMESKIAQLKHQKPHRESQGLKRRNKRATDVIVHSLDNGQHHSGGAMFVHWGRTSCSHSDTEVVYTGIAGGSNFEQSGGGSNYLCLPKHPQWGRHKDSWDNQAFVYGAEYQPATGSFPFSSKNAEGLKDHNVPCAVCRSKRRSSLLMIPAFTECVHGWTKEYGGYLTAGHHAHKGRTEYVCMDGDPEADPAGYRDEDGALFFAVEAACGSLPCPNYVGGREITCVVCTK